MGNSLKRTAEPNEDRDSKLAKLSDIQMELFERIAKEEDDLKLSQLRLKLAGNRIEQAVIRVQQVRIRVYQADSKSDRALQQTHHLEEFEAKYQLTKLELELMIATAEVKLESAKTERDRDRAEEDLDDARKELREVKEQWPAKLAEKKAYLANIFQIGESMFLKSSTTATDAAQLGPLPKFVSRTTQSLCGLELSFVPHPAYLQALEMLDEVVSRVPTVQGRDVNTVGLYGAMGVGKTRTAIEACNAAADFEVQRKRPRPLVLYGRMSHSWNLSVEMDSLEIVAKAIVIMNDLLQISHTVTFDEVANSLHRDGFTKVILYIDEVQVNHQLVERLVDGCFRTMVNPALMLAVIPILSGIALPKPKVLAARGFTIEIYVKPLEANEFLRAFAHQIGLAEDDVKASPNWMYLLKLCAGAPNVVDRMTRVVQALKETNSQFARSMKLIDDESASTIYHKTLDCLLGTYGPKRWQDMVEGPCDDAQTDGQAMKQNSYKAISSCVLQTVFLECFTGARIANVLQRIGTKDQSNKLFPTYKKCTEAGMFSYDAGKEKLSMSLMGMMKLNEIVKILPVGVNDPFNPTWKSFEVIGAVSIYLRLRLAQLRTDTEMLLGELRPGALLNAVENVRITIPSLVEFKWMDEKATGVPGDKILLDQFGNGVPVQLAPGLVAMTKESEIGIDAVIILNDTQGGMVVILDHFKTRDKNVGNRVASTALDDGTLISTIIPTMQEVKDRYRTQFQLPDSTLFVYDVFGDRCEPRDADRRLSELTVPYILTRKPQIAQSVGPGLAQLCG